MSQPLVLEGKSVAEAIEKDLAARVARLKERAGRTPVLATILVGSDPASATYVRMKGNACRRVGMESSERRAPRGRRRRRSCWRGSTCSTPTRRSTGSCCSTRCRAQIDERACFDRIAIEKDVDGVTALGFGRMSLGERAYGSATPAGIMRLLDHYGIPIEGRHAVVVGRSPILGKPMAMMLLNRHATVTICHSRTRDLPQIVRQADIVVAAVGRPRFVQGDWIKDGAVIVDAGYHPEKVGDVDLAAAAPRSSAYTPVPGGVGPMTIATLIAQTVEAAETEAGGHAGPAARERAGAGRRELLAVLRLRRRADPRGCRRRVVRIPAAWPTADGPPPRRRLRRCDPTRGPRWRGSRDRGLRPSPRLSFVRVDDANADVGHGPARTAAGSVRPIPAASGSRSLALRQGASCAEATAARASTDGGSLRRPHPAGPAPAPRRTRRTGLPEGLVLPRLGRLDRLHRDLRGVEPT